MQNILIWGTGRLYEENLTLIKYFEAAGQFYVAGLVPRSGVYSPRDFLAKDGFPILKEEALADPAYDWVLVCSSKPMNVIKKEARALRIAGIEEKLIPIRILSVPHFNFERYTTLVKSKLSIFANNAWGGYLSNYLGLRNYSPFVGLFASDRDYVAFLKDAREVIEREPLRYTGSAYAPSLRSDYPIYDLAGMTLHMNHYASREAAEGKWYERRQRINWDRLFLMLYSADEPCIRAFSELPCERKICFTPIETDVPCACTLPLGRINPGRRPDLIVADSARGHYGLYNHVELLLTGRVEGCTLEAVS